MRRASTIPLVVLGIALTPTLLFAQEEGERTWSVETEVSFVGMSGNSNTETLGLGARLDSTLGSWETEMKVSFIRSEADDELNARSFDTSFLSTRTLDQLFGLYTKGGYLSDRFAGIDNRYASEGGLSFDAVPEGAHMLTARGGFGWMRELRASDEDRQLWTANASARYTWTFSENAALTNGVAVTTDVRNREDWRLTNDLSLSAGLTSLFSLRLSHHVGFLNDPVPGFEKTDIKVSAAVVARF